MALDVIQKGSYLESRPFPPFSPCVRSIVLYEFCVCVGGRGVQRELLDPETYFPGVARIIDLRKIYVSVEKCSYLLAFCQSL